MSESEHEQTSQAQAPQRPVYAVALIAGGLAAALLGAVFHLSLVGGGGFLLACAVAVFRSETLLIWLRDWVLTRYRQYARKRSDTTDTRPGGDSD